MKPLALGIGILSIAAVAFASDNSALLLHPDQYKGLTEFKGHIETIDISSHRLGLTDSSNQKASVAVSSNTRVLDAGNHTVVWTDLRIGDPVIVYYEPQNQVALHIDRLPTPTEGVLSIDHPMDSKSKE